MRSSTFAVAIAVTWLAGCSQSAPPTASQADNAAPAPIQITAPAGRYELYPDHASLSFKINHLGLSNYVARFTKYKVTLDLDPANPTASSVVATVDPTSIRTDYAADFRTAMPSSKFQSWDENLAQSDKFFNATQHPQIEFRSTRVEQTTPGTMRIVGDLTLLGQTHPVTLKAKLVGSKVKHPYGGDGGAVGFSANGSFNRSSFGMNYLLKPPLVGDTVMLEFEGEFHQVAAQPATPAS